MSAAVDYQAPRYLPQSSVAWYHVLYGHVPGHQLDFIYRPHIPHQKLKPQHFSDLQLVIRHLQPAPQRSVAFAICNLSAHDTQHRPGHGGLGLVASMRAQDLRDHAGRVAPIFAHAALLMDTPVTAEFLSEASSHFLERFRHTASNWYRSYYESNQPLAIERQTAFIDQFADLPCEPNNATPVRWRSQRRELGFRQLLIECSEQTSVDEIRATASRLAAVLYHSGLRWLAISNGQDLDIPGLYNDTDQAALLIRFIYGGSSSPPNVGARPIKFNEVPADEDGIAALFGLARPRLPTQQPSPDVLVSALATAQAYPDIAEHALWSAPVHDAVPEAERPLKDEDPTKILDRKLVPAATSAKHESAEVESELANTEEARLLWPHLQHAMTGADGGGLGSRAEEPACAQANSLTAEPPRLSRRPDEAIQTPTVPRRYGQLASSPKAMLFLLGCLTVGGGTLAVIYNQISDRRDSEVAMVKSQPNHDAPAALIEAIASRNPISPPHIPQEAARGSRLQPAAPKRTDSAAATTSQKPPPKSTSEQAAPPARKPVPHITSNQTQSPAKSTKKMEPPRAAAAAQPKAPSQQKLPATTNAPHDKEKIYKDQLSWLNQILTACMRHHCETETSIKCSRVKGILNGSMASFQKDKNPKKAQDAKDLLEDDCQSFISHAQLNKWETILQNARSTK